MDPIGPGWLGLGGFLDGTSGSYAHSVSADGSVIVGNSVGTTEAMMWIDGTMQGLGDLAGEILTAQHLTCQVTVRLLWTWHVSFGTRSNILVFRRWRNTCSQDIPPRARN